MSDFTNSKIVMILWVVNLRYMVSELEDNDNTCVTYILMITKGYIDYVDINKNVTN